MSCSRIRFISGEIRQKRERYPGQHEAIVPRELWEAVQQRLRTTAARGGQPATSAIASPLAGKLFDADGEQLYVQGAAKAGRRYRYYVSRNLGDGCASAPGAAARVASHEHAVPSIWSKLGRSPYLE